MGEDLYELPQGWVWVNFSTVINKVKRGPSLKCNQEGLGIRYITSGNLANGQLNLNLDQKYLQGFDQIEKCKLKPGDLILNCVNSIEQIGKSAVFKTCHGEAIVGFNNYALELKNEAILSEFANYFCQTIIAKKQIYFLIKRAVNQVSFATRELDFISIPIPPIAEQNRIVSKIEELFTQLDAGVELLKKVKAKLKRYRQAVLKAAVEGNLTKEWREANQGELEPASVLLERILKQRREKWEAEQLAKMKAQGKTPKDDSWKLKYKEPVRPDISDLPELPDGWCWGTFDQVCERVTVGHVGSMKDEYIENGIPFLRSQNVRENRYNSEGIKFISPNFHTQLRKSSLEPGDLVVVRSGSVGVSCVIPETLKEANCSDLVIVKQPKAINPYFAAFYMNSVARSRVNAQQVGVALIHFNTQSMAAMPVPIPPIIEQLKIVEAVELLLSVIDQLEKTIDVNLKRAERLRQTILKQAFEGKLVPQDPNDEPAEKLLERIKAEKANREADKKPKRQSTIKSKQPRKSKTTATQLELKLDD
ncbi:restriction endonuclease subunit S [Nostoc sp. UHCC 0702]|nr:restriction endonuclease subunit S [Nostoc sp. UHCC 0702]